MKDDIKQSVNALVDNPQKTIPPPRPDKPPIGQKTGFAPTPVPPTGRTIIRTEISRVEITFTIPAGGTAHVPLQITLSGDDGNIYIDNYAEPTMDE